MVFHTSYFFICPDHKSRIAQFSRLLHQFDRQSDLHHQFYDSNKQKGRRSIVLAFQFLHFHFGQYLLKATRFVLMFSCPVSTNIQNLPMLHLPRLNHQLKPRESCHQSLPSVQWTFSTVPYFQANKKDLRILQTESAFPVPSFLQA